MSQIKLKAVYKFFKEHLLERGYPPLREEIAVRCGLPEEEVPAALGKLQDAGKLIQQNERWQSLRLAK